MRGGEGFSDFSEFEEDLLSIFPERCKGYVRVLLFFLRKFLEDPSQSFSAYMVEKEVVGVSRARPILERLVKSNFLIVEDSGYVTYYRLNAEKRSVQQLLKLLKQS